MNRTMQKDFCYLFGPDEFEGWPDKLLVKIGSTHDPASRLRSLRTGNPTHSFWHILFAPEYGAELERGFHILFASDNYNGDWFNLDSIQIRFFETRIWDWPRLLNERATLRSCRLSLPTQLAIEFDAFKSEFTTASHA